MEKIRRYLFLVILFVASNSQAQSWITGMTFDYGFSQTKWDSTSQHNILLQFPSLSYDETFDIALSDVSSMHMYGGFKNQFLIKKNLIIADLSVGLNLYQYSFDLSKKAGSALLDTNKIGVRPSDSEIWQGYLDEEEELIVSGVYPSIRVHLGYKRELVNYRNLALYADAGILGQRHFSFFQDFNKDINESGEPIYAHFGSALNHRAFIPSAYIGFSLRINSSSFGLRLGGDLTAITRKGASLQVKENFVQVTYTKLFKEMHLGREQVLYDEYQHLTQTRASEYRRGDKYSYLQFSFPHDKRRSYTNDVPLVSWLLEDQDSILVTTNGYYVQPNVGVDLMFNTFFTHRWMVGMGISMYEERYTSFGTITQNDLTTAFGDEILRSEPSNSYQEYWSKTKASVAINTAVYISKRAMKIDPYVRGAANMVMDYDIPEFLKEDPNWRTTSFFPVMKLGAGADVRLRLKSSKFFAIGAGVDYNINPHVNYLQYYVRIGYYRKKKLKNQTY